MRKLLFVGLLAACASESSSGPETLPDLNVPDKPANGLQAITPIVRGIQPGTDNEICTWTDAIVDRDVDVRSTIAFQTEPGHHTIVFYTEVKEPPGTQRVCTDQDMASFRFLAGNAGNGILNEAPGDLIYRIPKGAQIVINHHYLNASDEVMDGQSVVNINFADPGKTYRRSGSTAFLNSSLDIPPGVSDLHISCTMNREFKLWYFAPHMHRWGTNIKVDVVKSGVTERLFDTEWADEFTFHPPEKRNHPDDPLVLAKGDQVKVHCTWNNDTPNNLNFGFEMCVAFGQYVDVDGIGNLACDNGFWTEF